MVNYYSWSKNSINFIKYLYYLLYDVSYELMSRRSRESDEDVNSHYEFYQCSFNEPSEMFIKDDSDKSNTLSINKEEEVPQRSSDSNIISCASDSNSHPNSEKISESNNHPNSEKILENKNLLNIEKISESNNHPNSEKISVNNSHQFNDTQTYEKIKENVSRIYLI